MPLTLGQAVGREGNAVTEQEWMRCEDPAPMLGFLKGRASKRKLRLFGAACCRRVWHRLTEPCCRDAVEVREQLADGAADRKAVAAARGGMPAETRGQLRAGMREAALKEGREEGHAEARATAWAASWDAVKGLLRANAAEAAGDAAFAVTIAVAWGATEHAPAAGREAARKAAERAERKAHAGLLRDVVGDPFRPAPSVDLGWLAWNGGVVASLALAAYDERLLPQGHLDPARVAVLADALEDAGCRDQDILGHLRSPGPHVRGCWVIDLLLGKG